jgi:hypothetical protein
MKRLEETFARKIFGKEDMSFGVVQALVGGALIYVASKNGLYSLPSAIIGSSNLVLGLSIMGYNWLKRR